MASRAQKREMVCGFKVLEGGRERVEGRRARRRKRSPERGGGVGLLG